MKLIPIREVIEGNSIVVCEDSIVRGTQLKNFHHQETVGTAAPRKIHVRVACPPLMFPCRFNFSTRSIEELAARKAIRHIEGHDLMDVSEYLDPTSSKYERMVEVIRQGSGRHDAALPGPWATWSRRSANPSTKLCLYCWTGQCPKSACRRTAIDILETKKRSGKRRTTEDTEQQQLW